MNFRLFDFRTFNRIRVPFSLYMCFCVLFSGVCIRVLNGAPISVFESEDGFTPRNEIDAAVLEDLKAKNILPARLSSDAVFLRRVYLDVLGRIPSLEEARAFLNDPAPSAEKRARLIDVLLERPEFTDFWTLHWADFLRVKSEFPINLWPHGTAVYFRWLHDCVRENRPYDELARELLLGQGSCFRSPPANFYRAVERKDSVELASAAVLTFLGERTDLWPEEKRNNVTIFFSRVAFKGSAQWKEEIVFWDDTPLESPDVVFPDGSKGVIPPGTDPRAVFAQWLIRPENHAFNRALVNRLWYWLTGVGIIDPPDDIREQNPPANPKLLEVLERKLVDSRYDIKEVLRFILNSRTYQQASILNTGENPAENSAEVSKSVPDSAPEPDSGAVPESASESGAASDSDSDSEIRLLNAEKNLAVYPVRRLDAEVLQDMFIDLFDAKFPYTSEVPEPFSYIPARVRTVQLYDSGLTNPFLEMFGRSTRDSGLTTDRNNSVNEAQQMFLMNSNEINTWADKGVQQRLKNLRTLRRENPEKYEVKANEYCTELWLRFLSRRPTKEEQQRFLDVLNGPGASDIVWYLVNSREFLCRH